ncbi:MAG: hypothetical protein U5O44_02265 [Sphaerotilus sp.]|nr:hypothetical protein [Sphaerotilus sp.]
MTSFWRVPRHPAFWAVAWVLTCLGGLAWLGAGATWWAEVCGAGP